MSISSGNSNVIPMWPERAKREGWQAVSTAAQDLHAAIVEQREACRAFQDRIDELRDEIALVGANMGEYRDNLNRINVEPIHRRCRKLERMMAPYAANRNSAA